MKYSILNLKVFLARILTHPACGNFLKKIRRKFITIEGVKVNIDSPLISSYVTSLLFWGLYESSERRFIRRYLKKGLPVIELGTSIGVVASTAARTGGARIICVEANPKLVPLIHENLKINDVSNYKILNRAISYSGDSVSFDINDNNTVSKISTQGVQVPSITLTSILESEGIKDYVLICDIEGAEAEMLENDRSAFRHCRQVIIETHNTEYRGVEYSCSSMRDIFLSMGFLLIAQHGPNYVFEKPSP